MGWKGQRDQFAEAHLSAAALFTHHLRSERQASEGLSRSHNTAALHIGAGDTQGMLWWSAPSYQEHSPLIHPLLVPPGLQTKPNKQQKRLGLKRTFALVLLAAVCCGR